MKSSDSGKSRADKIWDLKVEIFSVLLGILATYFFFGSDKNGGTTTTTTVVNHWHIGDGLMGLIWGGVALIGIGALGRIIYIISKASDTLDALDDAHDITDIFDLF